MFAVTSVAASNGVPLPFVPVYQPSKMWLVFVGSVGKASIVVAGGTTVLLVGIAATVATWLSKVTVWLFDAVSPEPDSPGTGQEVRLSARATAMKKKHLWSGFMFFTVILRQICLKPYHTGQDNSTKKTSMSDRASHVFQCPRAHELPVPCTRSDFPAIVRSWRA